jgi:hypothetical protein
MKYNYNVYDAWPHDPHFSLKYLVRRNLIQCVLFFLTAKMTLMFNRPIRFDQLTDHIRMCWTSTDLIHMFEQPIEIIYSIY